MAEKRQARRRRIMPEMGMGVKGRRCPFLVWGGLFCFQVEKK